MKYFLVRYDCSEHILGLLDYCVHFMSRTPTMEPAKVDTETTFLISEKLNSCVCSLKS